MFASGAGSLLEIASGAVVAGLDGKHSVADRRRRQRRAAGELHGLAVYLCGGRGRDYYNRHRTEPSGPCPPAYRVTMSAFGPFRPLPSRSNSVAIGAIADMPSTWPRRR
jgi:hypothetical protein